MFKPVRKEKVAQARCDVVEDNGPAVAGVCKCGRHEIAVFEQVKKRRCYMRVAMSLKTAGQPSVATAIAGYMRSPCLEKSKEERVLHVRCSVVEDSENAVGGDCECGRHANAVFGQVKKL